MDPHTLSQPKSGEENRVTSEVTETLSLQDSLLSTETSHPDLHLTQSFTLTIDEGGGQLSTPQINRTVELSIPREIISSSISSTILHAELVRPIIAGTYHGTPAYLVRLQFQLEAPRSSNSLMSRIQNASIKALLEDAPVKKKTEPSPILQWDRKKRTAKTDSEPEHPSFVKTFPGPEGWEGPVSTAEISTEKELGLQAGWNGLGVNARWGLNRTREEPGALKMTVIRNGEQRNNLLLKVTEDPVQMIGIPSYLTFPLIVTHHSRRFSMRVSLNAKFGFWRGKLAETVPVLGRADEPLFFDPKVLQQMMETEEKGIGGIKVVDWCDKLEELELSAYSSLTSNNN